MKYKNKVIALYMILVGLLLVSIYFIFDRYTAAYLTDELIKSKVSHAKDTVSLFRKELIAGNLRVFERKLKDTQLGIDLQTVGICRNNSLTIIKQKEGSLSNFQCSNKENSFISDNKKQIMIGIPIYFDIAKDNLAISIIFAFSNEGIITAFTTYKMVLLGIFVIIGLLFFLFILYYNRFLSKPIASLFNKISAIVTEVDEKNEDNSYNKLSEYIPILAHIQTLQSSLVKVKQELKEKEKLAAISTVTQHLAHDIRKPFSQIKLILEAFEMFKSNPAQLASAKQDIEKSIKNVETMVADIMDFSREVKLNTKPTSVVPIFDFVIRQTMQSYSNPDIKFFYCFKAKNKPLLDEERFARVLGNIIGNGVEAITQISKRSSGTIFVETVETVVGEQQMIQLIIGNDGSLFPEGTISKLFESFYTSGKSKGTGLGLASVKKIVTLHNGHIFARNKEEGNGVEFVIQVPASKEKEQIDLSSLPENSQDIFLPTVEEGSVEGLTSRLEKENKEYRILLLEDEVLYRAWVRNLINRNKSLKNLVTIYDASTVDDALSLMDSQKIEYAIVDIDLNCSKNGYDFLNEVKLKYGNLKCLVHSNRTLKEDKDKAFEFGAVAFVPKPLPIESMVGFLANEELKDGVPLSLLPKKKVVYYCDDTSLMRDHFDMLCRQYQTDRGKEIDYQIFKTGEELLHKAKAKRPHLVLTDLNMREKGGLLNGYDVIKSIKKLSHKIRVYLISNEPLILSEQLTKEAGGDGALEQPMDQVKIFDLLDALFFERNL